MYYNLNISKIYVALLSIGFNFIVTVATIFAGNNTTAGSVLCRKTEKVLSLCISVLLLMAMLKHTELSVELPGGNVNSLFCSPM